MTLQIYRVVVLICLGILWKCSMWQEELRESHLKSIQDLERWHKIEKYMRGWGKNPYDQPILKEKQLILPLQPHEKDLKSSQLCLRQDSLGSAYQNPSSMQIIQKLNLAMSSGLTSTVGKTIAYEQEKIQRHKSW